MLHAVAANHVLCNTRTLRWHGQMKALLPFDMSEPPFPQALKRSVYMTTQQLWVRQR